MKQTKACMVCGKEKNGTDIEVDHVINTMRWFKENITRNAKGYRIVVCKECMPKYTKQRSKFVWRRGFYLAVAVLFTLAIGFTSHGRYLGVLLYGFVIIVFMYLLSLISYVPALKKQSGK